MQLVNSQFSCLCRRNSYSLYRVNFFQAWIFQEAQSSDPKHCMEYIDHVPWTICKTTQFWILCQ